MDRKDAPGSGVDESGAVAEPQVAEPAGGRAALPAHLLELGYAGWALWRCVFLRGAGFDARLVEPLASPRCAAAADAVLAARDSLEEARAAAITALGQALDAAPDEPQRRQTVRALKHLRHGRPLDDAHVVPEPARKGLLAAAARLERAQRDLDREFHSAVTETAEHIRAVILDPRLREAVLLQNAPALRAVERSLARAGPIKRTKKERQGQELIASYLQRYCLKNDTIGFFGPVGWATFAPKVRGIEVRPGPELIKRSSVYFENWAIEALAQRLSRDHACLPSLRPRLLPLFEIEGDQLLAPGGGRIALSQLDAHIMRRCDGERSARQLALELLARPELGLARPEDVYDALHRLVARRTVSWTIELPSVAHPEQWLRRALESIEAEPFKSEALAQLDQLEAGRDAVERALGDPERVSDALQALDETFERLTGRSAQHSAGQMYAGRTLVYLDCERDLEARIGGDIVAALAGPLALVLASARWLTHHAAACYREAFGSIYEELSQRLGAAVPLTVFFSRAQPLLLDPRARVLNRPVEEFGARWRGILRLAAEQRVAHYTSHELRAAVEEAFAAPRAGWEVGRYHSPDVMIAAASAEAIARGDYQAVMGELHLAMHTFRGAFTLAQHPRPEELQAAIDADSSSPGISLVPPRAWPRATGRTSLALVPRHNHHVEISHDTLSSAARARTLSVAALVVEDTPLGLHVRTRDGRLSVDVVDFFGEVLSASMSDVMKTVLAGAHVPRLVIDNVVLLRESWTVGVQALDFVDLDDEQERYAEARRWKRSLGLPRRVFASVAVETKPFFVDFDSPIYVEIFVKMLRRQRASASEAVVALSEMLPGPDQLWLRDRDQRHYTSEIRIVARDLQP
jgi:hypothetical protein